MAVISAMVSTLTRRALTIKFPLVAAGGMTTDEGTVMAKLSLERLTVVLSVRARLRLTVQDKVAGGVTIGGVHARLESRAGAAWLIVMEPLLAMIGKGLLDPLAATGFISETGVEAFVVAAAI